MRRVIFLVVVVIILLFASLMVGLGWYLYIPKKINEIVEKTQNQRAQQIQKNISPAPVQEEARSVNLKLGERAGYKRNRYAELNVTITNLDNFKGDAEILAVLYYAQTQVANSTATMAFNANEKSTRTIIVNTTEQWNAFDVKQIS